METPAHYQDLKYHLHELEEKIKLHEEWLHALQLGLPCADIMQFADKMIAIADRHAHLTHSTLQRFAELFPQSPSNVEPEAWNELLASLRDSSRNAEELFHSARRLYEYARENCEPRG